MKEGKARGSGVQFCETGFGGGVEGGGVGYERVRGGKLVILMEDKEMHREGMLAN